MAVKDAVLSSAVDVAREAAQGPLADRLAAAAPTAGHHSGAPPLA